MITTLTAFLSGLIFSLGLIVAGAVHPGMVQSFLDVAGVWNPAVGLMMLSAIVTAAPAFYWVGRKKYRTLLSTPSFIPRTRPIDWQLVLGSAIIGVGWGWSGFDPGPGLVAAGSGCWMALLFMVATGVGLHLALRVDIYLLRRRQTTRGV